MTNKCCNYSTVIQTETTGKRYLTFLRDGTSNQRTYYHQITKGPHIFCLLRNEKKNYNRNNVANLDKSSNIANFGTFNQKKWCAISLHPWSMLFSAPLNSIRKWNIILHILIPQDCLSLKQNYFNFNFGVLTRHSLNNLVHLHLSSKFDKQESNVTMLI